MSNMNKVLGFERINERRQRPNKLINFIKPLEGSDKDFSQDFLERVAAICYPIMKANNVVVMSLEEYPPNKEFWGRNFNAGEVIQLVLKSPGNGQWLPFKHVQMVMMHELAHCKQMNHSRNFWAVNNAFRDELKGLWDRKYNGEGLWGRGQTLLSGRYSTDHMPEAAEAPSNLCGGTYRSRGGRKRKRADPDKPQLTYAERKQRRIAKKFGANGQALGVDELARWNLDQGRHRPSKPRVANSKRGRELRVAAALARFDKKPETPKEESVSLSDDEYETDSEDDGESLQGITGSWEDNDNVVRVCQNEDLEDADAQRELDELREIDKPAGFEPVVQENDKSVAKQPKKKPPPTAVILDDESTESDIDSQASTISDTEDTPEPSKENSGRKITNRHGSKPVDKSVDLKKSTTASTTGSTLLNSNSTKNTIQESSSAQPKKDKSRTKISTTISEAANPAATAPPPAAASISAASTTVSCPVCSMENERGAATCIMCAHVLDTNKIKNSWQCQSEACKGSVYRNLGDYGRCYVCQTVRPDPDRVY